MYHFIITLIMSMGMITATSSMEANQSTTYQFDKYNKQNYEKLDEIKLYEIKNKLHELAKKDINIEGYNSGNNYCPSLYILKNNLFVDCYENALGMAMFKDLILMRLAFVALGDVSIRDNLHSTLMKHMGCLEKDCGLRYFFSPLLLGTQGEAIQYIAFLANVHIDDSHSLDDLLSFIGADSWDTMSIFLTSHIVTSPTFNYKKGETDFEITNDESGKTEKLVNNFIYVIEQSLIHGAIEPDSKLYGTLNQVYNSLNLLKLPYSERKGRSYTDVNYFYPPNIEKTKHLITVSLCLNEWANVEFGNFPNDIRYVILLTLLDLNQLNFSSFQEVPSRPDILELFTELGFIKPPLHKGHKKSKVKNTASKIKNTAKECLGYFKKK